MPIIPIFRDVFEAGIARENKSRRLLSPASDAGESIGTISDNCEIVWNRFRLHPKLFLDAGLIPQNVSAAIELHNSFPADALSEILVGCADQYLLDLIVLCRLK